MHTAAWLCTHANNNCSNVYINICGLGFVSSASSPLLNDAQIKCVTLLNSIAYCSHRLADITHAWWYFKTNSPPTLSNTTSFKLNLLLITNLYAKLFPDMQNVVPDMLSVSVWQISILDALEPRYRFGLSCGLERPHAQTHTAQEPRHAARSIVPVASSCN